MEKKKVWAINTYAQPGNRYWGVSPNVHPLEAVHKVERGRPRTHKCQSHYPETDKISVYMRKLAPMTRCEVNFRQL